MPDYDQSVHYVREWLDALHGRSGVSMNGLSPLTYTTIRDWAALTGAHPTAAEVQALLRLDGILLHPPEELTDG